MRLTRTLLFYVKKKKIPGHLELGKKQLVKPVTCSKKLAAVRELIMEKENLEVLSNPWMTEEEENAYIQQREELGIPDIEREKEINKIREERMFKHRNIADYLNHLNCAKSWE